MKGLVFCDKISVVKKQQQKKNPKKTHLANELLPSSIFNNLLTDKELFLLLDALARQTYFIYGPD